MSGLGVHFALMEGEVEELRSLSDEREQLEHLLEAIEPAYFERDPGFMAETDRWWDPIHRALTDGRLNWASGEYPLSHAVLAGESLYAGTDYIMSLKTPKQVREISAALAGVTEEEFHERYLRIEEASYGFPLSEEDFQSTWEWFLAVRKLYGKAAKAGRFVLFTADQ
ncbi:hypothetical protein BH09VER1_BH09VER1_51050 [soil metagenome]